MNHLSKTPIPSVREAYTQALRPRKEDDQVMCTQSRPFLGNSRNQAPTRDFQVDSIALYAQKMSVLRHPIPLWMSINKKIGSLLIQQRPCATRPLVSLRMQCVRPANAPVRRVKAHPWERTTKAMTFTAGTRHQRL